MTERYYSNSQLDQEPDAPENGTVTRGFELSKGFLIAIAGSSIAVGAVVGGSLLYADHLPPFASGNIAPGSNQAGPQYPGVTSSPDQAPLAATPTPTRTLKVVLPPSASPSTKLPSTTPSSTEVALPVALPTHQKPVASPSAPAVSPSHAPQPSPSHNSCTPPSGTLEVCGTAVEVYGNPDLAHHYKDLGSLSTGTVVTAECRENYNNATWLLVDSSQLPQSGYAYASGFTGAWSGLPAC